MKKLLLAVVLSSLSQWSAAGNDYVPEFAQGLGTAEKDLSPAQRAALERAKEILGPAVARGEMPPLDNPQGIAIGAQALERGREVVNEALVKEREAALRAMGVDPAAKGRLYIFISTSMPEELILAYARDAMWSGAGLVVRGVPPHMTLQDYLRKRVAEWVRNKGATANVDIDPRLFDLYQVKVAPTIVFTTAEDPLFNLACVTDPVTWQGTSLKTCSEADPAKYWKIEGAVTMTWALDTMRAEGAPVEPFQEAYAKGGLTQGSKDQKPFTGDWAAAATPAELADANKALEGTGLRAYLTPDGRTAVGPEGMSLGAMPQLGVQPQSP